MRTVTLTYIAILAAWGAFFATQIVIPALRGSLLFPFFRTKHREAEGDLVEVTDEAQIKMIRNHIAWKRSQYDLPGAPETQTTKTKKKNGV